MALAIAGFRAGEINIDAPGPMTESRVTVLRKPIEHRIRLKQGDEGGAVNEGGANEDIEEAKSEDVAGQRSQAGFAYTMVSLGPPLVSGLVEIISRIRAKLSSCEKTYCSA